MISKLTFAFTFFATLSVIFLHEKNAPNEMEEKIFTVPKFELEKGVLRAEIPIDAEMQEVQICNLEVGKTYYFLTVKQFDCESTVQQKGNKKSAPTLKFVATELCQFFEISKLENCGNSVLISIAMDGTNKPKKKTDPSKIANIAVSSATATHLIENVLLSGNCANVSNITLNGGSVGIGEFSNGSSSIGIASGIIISTGNINQIPGPNSSTNGVSSTVSPNTTDPDLQQLLGSSGLIKERNVIEFDFIPATNTVSFNYVFASEEYCDFVNSQFNDAFGFFISGPGISGPFSNNGENIALIPGSGSFVSINSVNWSTNPAYYVDNVHPSQAQSSGGCTNAELANFPFAPNDIEFDGFTSVLTATATVVPGQTYHIKLAVGDAGDHIYDSAVFLQANSFNIGNVQATANSPICEGGTLQLDEIGGSSTGWNWDGPNSFTSSIQNPTIPSVSSIHDGLYTVTATNATGCTDVSSVNVTVVPPIAISNLPDVTMCEDGNVPLSPVFTGGDGNYSCSWFPIIGLSDPSSCNPTVMGLPAGTYFYTLTVMDGSGCVSSDVVVVTVEACPPCECTNCPVPITDNGSFDGLLNVQVNGANDLGQCPLQSVCFTIEHTYVGDLAVTLTSPGGLNFLVMADENNAGHGAASQDNVEVCIDIGTGNPLTNATPYPCNFGPCSLGNCCLNGSWTMPCNGVTDPITGAVQAPNCDLNDFNIGGQPANGTWTLTVNDVCAQDIGFLVDWNLTFACGTLACTSCDNPPTAIATSNSPICEGQTLQLDEIGGQATMWEWSGPNSFTSTIKSPSIPAALPIHSGTYTVIAKDALGCADTATVDVDVYPMIEIYGLLDTTVCEFKPVSLNPIIAGGSGNFSCVWSPPMWLNNANICTPVFKSPIAGTYPYTVLVTDNVTGCTGTASITLTAEVCCDSIILDCNACSSPCVMPGQDLVFNGDFGFGDIGFNSNLPSNCTCVAGSYCVDVNATMKCQNSLWKPIRSPNCQDNYMIVDGSNGMIWQQFVLVQPGMTYDFGFDYYPNVSDGTSATLEMRVGTNVVLSNIVAPLDTWSRFCESWTSTVTTPTFIPLEIHQTVSATRNDYGIDNISFTECVSNLMVMTNPDTMVCAGQPVQLNTIVTGDIGGYTCSWSCPTVLSNPNSCSPIFNSPTSGIYSCVVTVTDSLGCSNTDTVIITVKPLPTVIASSNSPICEGQTLQLDEIGGQATMWNWTGPNSFISIIKNPIIPFATINDSGTYTVIAQDSMGCADTSSVNVTVYAPIVIGNLIGTDVCEWQTLPLNPIISGGSGSFTCSWSPAPGLSNPNICNPNFKVTTAGIYTYTLTVLDLLTGCDGTATITINVTNCCQPVATTCAACNYGCFTTGQDLAINGDFSGGNTGFSSGLPFDCSCAIGSYCVDDNALDKCANSLWKPIHSPDCTDNYLIVDGANGVIWSQTITPTANTTYDFGFDYYPNISDGASPTLELWVDGIPILQNIVAPLDTWTRFCASWTASAPPSPSVVIEIRQVVAASRSDYGIDNIRFTECILPPMVSIFPDTIICENEVISLNPIITGGAGTVTCQWFPVTGLSNPNICNPTFTSLNAGTFPFTVTVTDTSGCVDSAMVIITVIQCCTNQMLSCNACNTCTNLGTELVFNGDFSFGNIGFTSGLPFNCICDPGSYCVDDNARDKCTVSGWQFLQAPDCNDFLIVDGNNGNVWAQNVSVVSGKTYNFSFAFYPNISGINSPTLSVLANSANVLTGVTAPAGSWSTFCGTWISNTTGSIPLAIQQTASGGNADYGIDLISFRECAPDPFITTIPDTIICENESIVLVTTITGGTGPVNCIWAPTTGLSNPTDCNPILSGLPIGSHTYVVTAVDSVGCMDTDTVLITVNPKPVVIASSNSPICQGEDLNLMETGGQATMWMWTGPNSFTSTAQNPTILSATAAANGTYTVIGKDANNCADTVSTTVTVTTPIVITNLPDSTLCEWIGLPLNPTISGGSGSYTCAWTPSLNLNNANICNPVFNSPNPGVFVHTLTVTDNVTGCMETEMVTITVDSCCTPIPTFCNACVATCTGPGTELVFNGDFELGNTGFTSSLNNNCSCAFDSYCIEDNPRNKCNNGAWQLIKAPDCGNYMIIDSPSPSTNSDLWIQPVNVVSGVTYNFSFAHFRDISGGGGPVLEMLADGNSVLAGITGTSGTWTNHCAAWTSNVNGAINIVIRQTAGSGNNDYGIDAISFSACSNEPVVTTIPDTIICDNQTIVLATNIVGGVAPFTCLWTPITGLSNSSDCNPTLSGISAGAHTYSVTVTDVNGCTDETDVTVTVANPTITSITHNSPCEGDDLILGVLASPTPTSYSWTGPSGFSDTAPSPLIPNVTSANSGVYSVTITAGNGCTAVSSLNIPIKTNPIITTITHNNPCEGDDLILGVLASPTPTSYSWTGPSGFSDTAPSPLIPNVTSANSGVYSVTITAGNGCTATSSLTILINANPAIVVSSNSPICEGQLLQLSESGGQGITWSWTGPNGFGASGQNPTIPSATVAASGTYNVTVTGSNGCTSVGSTNVTVYPAIGISNLQDTIVCEWDFLTLNPVISGGSGSFTCLWTPSPNLNNQNICNPTFQSATSGIFTYTLLVTDDLTGCTETFTFTITVQTCCTPAMTGCNACNGSCFGSDLVMNGDFESGDVNIGSTLPSSCVCQVGSYCIATNARIKCNNSLWKPITAPNCLGNYMVVDGAITTIWSQTVTPNAGSTYNFAFDFYPNISDGASPTLELWVDGAAILTGITAPLDLWTSYCEDWTAVNSNPVLIEIRQSVLAFRSDFGIDNVSFTECSGNPVVSTISNTTICENESLVLSTTITGGIPPVTCSWLPTTGLSNSSDCNPTLSGLTAGVHTYTVTATDAAGCMGTASVTVTVLALPTIIVGNNGPLCEGQDLQLFESGGQAVSWNWTGPGSFSSTAQNPLILAATTTDAGTYTVTITDSNGCTNSASTTVVIHPGLSVNNMGTLSVCEWTPLTLNPTILGGSGSFSCLWSSGTYLNNVNSCTPVFKRPTAGFNTYTLIVTDNLTGCTASASVTIITAICCTPVVTGCNACSNFCGSNELVTNGDFGFGNSGFGSGLPNNCNCSSGSYCISDNALNKCTNSLWKPIRSPNCTDNYMIVDGANGQIWSQPVTVVNGSTYYFAFDFYPNVSDGSSPTLEMRANGNIILTNIVAPLDTWTNYCAPWTADVTGNIVIEIRQIVSAFRSDYGIDNVSFKECFDLDVTTIPDTTICVGESIILSTIIKGGVAPITCSWSPAIGLSNPTDCNPSLDPSLPIGVYQYVVTVTDGNMCTDTDTVTIIISDCCLDFAAPTIDPFNLNNAANLMLPGMDFWDVNGDGIEDLLFSDFSQDLRVHINIGSATVPLFNGTDVSTGYIAESIYNYDYNQDGFMDFFGWVGTELHYFENQTTVTGGFYDYGPSVALGIFKPTAAVSSYAFPAIGDLTNDGLPDLVISYQDPITGGVMLFYENNSGSISNPPSFSLTGSPQLPINCGPFPVPEIFDGNCDMFPDLFIGTIGEVLYLENDGTITTGSLPPLNYGGVVSNPFGINGISNLSQHVFPRFVDIDNDSNFELFINDHHQGSSRFLYFENNCICPLLANPLYCSLPNLVIHDVPIPPDTYRAMETIFSEGSVLGNVEVNFRAGESITLDKEFTVELGSVFSAEIEDCNNINASPPSAALGNPSPDPSTGLKIEKDVSTGLNSIQYQLQLPSSVEIALFNSSGERVLELVKKASHSLGSYQVSLSENELPSGVYQIVMHCSEGVFVEKIVVVGTKE